MTQIIKVRAYHPEEKKMYCVDLSEYMAASEYAQDELMPHEARKNGLMLFTGLLDKNGKEIYESDIVQYYDNPHWVEFYAGCFVIKRKDHEKWYGVGSFGGAANQYEVIGNVWENPELLK